MPLHGTCECELAGRCRPQNPCFPLALAACWRKGGWSHAILRTGGRAAGFLRAQLRRGDVLIVTRLDRLARSVSQASGMITDMIDEGITINVLNLGILSNDSVNTLLRNVLLSFAQFERDMIVQRTQEGKAVARATDPDFREGRPPKFDTEQLDHAMELLENHSYTQVVKLTGISKSTLIREKKRRQA